MMSRLMTNSQLSTTHDGRRLLHGGVCQLVDDIDLECIALQNEHSQHE